MRTVATLIARGGSTRLPGKNVRPFCGLPLIAWSIIQARCSRLIDEVWMSTDDDEIQAVSEEFGAKVIRYPEDGAHTSNEASGGLPPTRDMLQKILGVYGDEFDCWVGMLPTCPLRAPDQLDRLVATYRSGEKRVMQAIPRREMVLHEKAGDGLRLALFDKWYTYFDEVGGTGVYDPRQFLEETGAKPTEDKLVDAAMVKMAQDRSGPIKAYIELEVWQQADVDTLAEFELAEVLMERYILKGRGRAVYDDYAKVMR